MKNNVGTAAFISEDSYLGDIRDPLSLNRYNYTKSNPLNYIDPTGYITQEDFEVAYENLKSQVCGLLLKFYENFGFDSIITNLIIKVYSGLMVLAEDFGEERLVGQYLGIKLSDSNINQIFSILMYSPSYGNQMQWKITAHLVGTASVRSMLGMVGLMEDEVAQLMEAISNQHSISGQSKEIMKGYVEKNEVSEADAQYAEKTDFAHMFATIAAHYDPTIVSDMAGWGAGMFGIVSDTPSNAGYAGDIFGFADIPFIGGAKPSMGPDDYTADLDAVNIYNRTLDDENMLFIMDEYFKEVSEDDELRAVEFAENLGGTYEHGLRKLKEQLDKMIENVEGGFYPYETDIAEKFYENKAAKKNQWD